jgi:hypothetical protein
MRSFDLCCVRADCHFQAGQTCQSRVSPQVMQDLFEPSFAGCFLRTQLRIVKNVSSLDLDPVVA